jgi:hypothetical protein
MLQMPEFHFLKTCEGDPEMAPPCVKPTPLEFINAARLYTAVILCGARIPYDYADGPVILSMLAPFVTLRANLTVARSIGLMNLRLRQMF